MVNQFLTKLSCYLDEKFLLNVFPFILEIAIVENVLGSTYYNLPTYSVT